MSNNSILELIGISFLSLFALRISLSISKGIWSTFLGHALGFGIKWKTGDNVWAVVTGATDGIGLQYAKQLANIGYNLVIISRSEDKLRVTANDLKQTYKNCKEVKTITADFSRTDIYDKISKELNSLEVIDVLVNNVGVLYKCPEYFTEIDPEFNESYFNVNMFSYIKLTEIVLPKMVYQSRGIIINISSQCALSVVPLMTTYSATKAFNQFLSEGISVEYQSKGVTVQTVLPSITKTKLANEAMVDSFFAVGADDFVSAAIKTVGIESTTFGHWKHKLLAYFITNVNNIFGRRNVAKLTLGHLDKQRNQFYQKTDRKID